MTEDEIAKYLIYLCESRRDCPICGGRGYYFYGTCEAGFDKYPCDCSHFRSDELLNLHGSLSGGGRKRRKFKKTVIPQGIELPVDEDDDKLTKYYDAEITDEITDTTIEDVLNG